jgi:hypothetical protein
MGVSPKHLLSYVIEPVLKDLGLYSPEAAQLLLATAAQESSLGEYLVQLGEGPALGIFQMEPNTHDDIYDNYLFYRPELRDSVEAFLFGGQPPEFNLVSNLAYMTAMARIHYLRVPEALPALGDIAGMARYWKKFYNTSEGKGTEEEFKHNFHRFGLDKL